MADHTVTVESTLEALLVEKKYSTIRDILIHDESRGYRLGL